MTKTIKAFETAVRAALAQSKAERNPVKRTTHPIAVAGFEGWKARFFLQGLRNGWDVPAFELTGPNGKTARATNGRLKECCAKAVRGGNGIPTDTIFVTYFF